MDIVVPKKSGTYADALCAIGYASLLAELRRAPVRIRDADSVYEVCSPSGIAPEEWTAVSPGFVYIWRKSVGPRPQGASVMDYEEEKAIADGVKKANAGAKKAKGSARAKKHVEAALEEVNETASTVNSPEYRFAAMIESMRKGWTSDQSLYRWIIQHPAEAAEALRSRLQGNVSTVGTDWSNSQLLNPSTGKGVHASKTISKSAGSFKLVDVVEEWMKLRGMWASMLAYRSGEDFKFFVVIPGDIEITWLEKLRTQLRDLGMWGVVRLEIEALLRLLQQLMLHSEFKESNGISVGSRTPRMIVSGLQLAFFKSLGTAAALMNDSILPLPAWFKIEDIDDVEAYLEICEEPFGAEKGKYGPLSALKDDRSDEVELLQKYRRWLTSGDLKDLLEFHASFASHLLRKVAVSDFAPQFRTSTLHRLLTKGYPSVKEIIDSKGFQNIARAIRNTTIYAAGMKNSKREIRFGLAQKLKQRIKAGDREFLAEICDFVQKQNWEIVHRLGGKGFQVTEADLNDIVLLTEKYRAELVGMLLLAYGFSRAETTVNAEEVPELEPSN